MGDRLWVYMWANAVSVLKQPLKSYHPLALSGTNKYQLPLNDLRNGIAL